MKYKVGDKVRIKSLEWYNEIKDESDDIECSNNIWFYREMSKFCGKVMTISHVRADHYTMVEDLVGYWTDEMIECKVEEETKPEPKFKVGDLLFYRGETCGYLKVEEIHEENSEIRYYGTNRNIYLVENDPHVFVDKVCSVETEETKNNNDMETDTHRGYYTTEEETTNKSKKVAWFTFGDNDFADKVELDLSNRELIQEDNKWFVVKKKPKYPKTYDECCEILGCVAGYVWGGYKGDLIKTFHMLYICRDAYWKIAGEEMGLGKPWKPNWDKCNGTKYCIYPILNSIRHDAMTNEEYENRILAFPTEEMRDAFYKAFKKEIEICKELL